MCLQALFNLLIKCFLNSFAVAASMYYILGPKVTPLEILQVALGALVISSLIEFVSNKEQFITSKDAALMMKEQEKLYGKH